MVWTPLIECVFKWMVICGYLCLCIVLTVFSSAMLCVSCLLSVGVLVCVLSCSLRCWSWSKQERLTSEYLCHTFRRLCDLCKVCMTFSFTSDHLRGDTTCRSLNIYIHIRIALLVWVKSNLAFSFSRCSDNTWAESGLIPPIRMAVVLVRSSHWLSISFVSAFKICRYNLWIYIIIHISVKPKVYF